MEGPEIFLCIGASSGRSYMGQSYNINADTVAGELAAAMGAENTTFERDGEVSIGLTYMTGALVKLGQRLAGAIMGGPKLAWAPYLMLWLGLVGGAVAGALAWRAGGLVRSLAAWPARG